MTVILQNNEMLDETVPQGRNYSLEEEFQRLSYCIRVLHISHKQTQLSELEDSSYEDSD